MSNKTLLGLPVTCLISTCLSLGYSFNVYAGPSENEAMYKMIASLMQQQTTKEVDEAASCLGLPKPKLLSSADAALKNCYSEHKAKPTNIFPDVLSECIETAIPKLLGISKQQLMACDTESAEEIETMASYDGPMDSQMLLRQAASELDESLSMISKASEESLSVITLPIYKNSQVIVHAIGGMEIDGNKALPAATFASSDSPEMIYQYYRNKLPGYTVSKAAAGEYLLMKSAPAGFDVIKDFSIYTTTPHIYIQSYRQSPLKNTIPENTKSIIEIAYSN